MSLLFNLFTQKIRVFSKLYSKFYSLYSSILTDQSKELSSWHHCRLSANQSRVNATKDDKSSFDQRKRFERTFTLYLLIKNKRHFTSFFWRKRWRRRRRRNVYTPRLFVPRPWNGLIRIHPFVGLIVCLFVCLFKT